MKSSKDKILFASYYSFFINGVAGLIISAIMHNILSDFSLGYDKGGFLLSVLSIGNLIASVITTNILFKTGYNRGSVLVSLLVPIAFLILVFTSNYYLLVLIFFLTGFGRGSASNISNTVVNKISNGDVSKLNLLHSFYAVGAFVAPLLASLFLNRGLSWRMLTAFITICAFVMPLNYKLVDLSSVSESKEGTSGNKYGFLKKKEFFISSAILFFYVGAEYAVSGWMVIYLKDTGLMSASLSQIVLSLLWLVIFLGRLLTGYISTRMSTKNILFFSSLGVLLCFVFFMFQTNTGLIIASIFGLGLFLSGIYPTTIADLGKKLSVDDDFMGMILGISGLGGIIMPYLTGVIAEAYDIYTGMIVILVSMVLMLVLTLINKVIKTK